MAMKKLLGILVLGLLWCNISFAQSFTCRYSGGESEIEISGSSATEMTSAGIVISYSSVNLTDKGAYSLKGSSKDTRAWFIGAISFLLLDANMIPADCK